MQKKSTAPKRKPPTVKAVCGARTRKGSCMFRAGLGTDHPGVGRCSRHGGNTRKGIEASGVEIARTTAAISSIHDRPIMGMPLDMDPTEALLWCVRIAAGEVQYLTIKVQELEEKDLIVQERTTSREYGENTFGEIDVRKVETTSSARLHVLVVERQRAMDRLSRFSKMALDAGVAERQVALAEKMSGLIATVIGDVMTELKLTERQLAKLETVLPAALMQLEHGS